MIKLNGNSWDETFTYIYSLLNTEKDIQQVLSPNNFYSTINILPNLKEWAEDKNGDYLDVIQFEVSKKGMILNRWSTPKAHICTSATRWGILINGFKFKYRGVTSIICNDDVWVGLFNQYGNPNIIILRKGASL